MHGPAQRRDAGPILRRNQPSWRRGWHGVRMGAGVTGFIREPVNGISHLAGALASVAGLTVLLVLSAGDARRTTSFAVYGATLVLLYTASALYHSLPVGPRARRLLQRLDHAAVFALIAGTYTPIALVTLARHAALGWTLFGIVWGAGALGVALALAARRQRPWLSTSLYLALGWTAIVAIVPIARALPAGGLAWLIAGGLVYSIGAVVYATHRPNPFPGVLGFHELWHFFVLAGSACHFVLMLRYVLPA